MTREEAIRRIENHIRIHSKQEPFRACHIQEALEMAVVALKAQEARLLTLIEASGTQDGEPIFAELRDDDFPGVWIIAYPGEWNSMHRAQYNKTWRCWTSRPTDEQREATPWN